MSANLLEFIKVFSIVFTFSVLLLTGHNYMSRLDDEEDSDENKNTKKILPFKGRVDLERTNTSEPDFIDYDGMGNQGRFPSRSNVERIE